MGWELVLLLFFGSLIVLLLLGMPVALAFLTVSMVGALAYWGGGVGVSQMSLSLVSSVRNWSLLPIPLFVLMGELLFQSGMASRSIDVVDMWLGRVPGRLAVVGVVSSALMGTFTGSSLACGSVLASTLVPEMDKRGYKKVMSIGPISGTGGLAMMIPPSGLAVFLATLAGVSVEKLLIGGIIPGLIMGSLYIGYIIVRSWLQPSVAPPYVVPPIPLSKRLWAVVVHLLPLALVVFLVTGVILFGIATPSEAAATGTLGGFLVTLLYRAITWEKVKAALVSTIKISAMLFTIMLGSVTFSQILSFSGATKAMVGWVTSLSIAPILIIIALQLVVFILGCFMEVNSIIMITIPIFMPIVRALGFNEIWFLLLYMMNCEMAESTPPFGVMLFLMKGMFPKVPMLEIIKSGLPYLATDAFAMALVMIFPQVALWLPSLM